MSTGGRRNLGLVLPECKRRFFVGTYATADSELPGEYNGIEGEYKGIEGENNGSTNEGNKETVETVTVRLY